MVSENKPKYTDEQYLSCGFWPSHENESNRKAKMVKTRKDHTCWGGAYNCEKTILAGSEAMYKSAIVEDVGWVSAYTCLRCLDRWIDDHGR